jgi:hypothetical protein
MAGSAVGDARIKQVDWSALTPDSMMVKVGCKELDGNKDA